MEHGLSVVATYLDAAHPGRTFAERAAGACLLSDADDAAFDAVIVVEMSQLGRSVDVVPLVAELQARGIAVHVAENAWSSPLPGSAP